MNAMQNVVSCVEKIFRCDQKSEFGQTYFFSNDSKNVAENSRMES